MQPLAALILCRIPRHRVENAFFRAASFAEASKGKLSPHRESEDDLEDVLGAEMRGSGRGSQDEGLDHMIALGASVDDFSFDVGAVQKTHINGVPLGRFGVEIAHVR